jgi:hypothetical protein
MLNEGNKSASKFIMGIFCCCLDAENYAKHLKDGQKKKNEILVTVSYYCQAVADGQDGQKKKNEILVTVSYYCQAVAEICLIYDISLRLATY